ncbi:YoaK family protein [Roseateles sp. SL47]|uniref:YoaK family protein n=1 Tax=Roseateles sp. SL47 TaxID=2995138 RepID=UPI00226E3D64|nr:YoaK family protein [Roseateles sp. SL47]WAC71507.1 YoaK family protein [Roseateles sp. SL47]
MPVAFARQLTGPDRTQRADRHLGLLLAAVAGALNAGGFLAVRQYTSHVTGAVSSVADNLVLGEWALVVDAIAGVLAFVLGAMTCALLVNFARRARLRSEFAIALLLEAVLILVFGLLGARLAHNEALFIPLTVALLCYIMGLQNAVITKVSNAVIRTTHMTGIVTDMGIELGKLVYINRGEAEMAPVRANRDRLAMLAGLLCCFLVGGLLGAYGFQRLGYISTVPMAVVLATLALVPVVDDVKSRWGASH